MNPKQRKQITSIIDGVKDMTIATVREDGFPQATTVSYVNDELDIYFMTGAEAQKTKNIENNNKVSMTFDSDYEDWQHIEGLSMAGLADFVTDPEKQSEINQMLLDKFPQAANMEPMEGVEPVYVHVAPVVISLLDYQKGFGHTDLFDLRQE